MEFNVNSPVQLAEVLFGRLGLPTRELRRRRVGIRRELRELDKLEETCDCGGGEGI